MSKIPDPKMSIKKPASLLGRRKLCIASVYLFSALLQSASADVLNVRSQPGETDRQFVQRVSKVEVIGAEDNIQLARTTKLIKDREVLIAFTETPFDEGKPASNSDNIFDVSLNVFIKNKAQSYRYLEPIVACEVEGGSASLGAFFYIDLVDEPRPVVGVICGWQAYHAAAECPMNNEVRFYKITETEITALPMDKYKSVFYKNVKSTVNPEFDCTAPRFEAVADVKRLLVRAAGKSKSVP